MRSERRMPEKLLHGAPPLCILLFHGNASHFARLKCDIGNENTKNIDQISLTNFERLRSALVSVSPQPQAAVASVPAVPRAQNSVQQVRNFLSLLMSRSSLDARLCFCAAGHHFCSPLLLPLFLIFFLSQPVCAVCSCSQI